MNCFSFAYVRDGGPGYLSMYTVDSALILPLHTPVIAGDAENQLPPRRYFSFTLEVMDWKRILRRIRPMSALPPKADVGTHSRNVRFVPKRTRALNGRNKLLLND